MAEFQESTLYSGKVEIKFYPVSHRYYVNGKIVPGVTTIIGIKDKSTPLVIWATELYRDFLIENLDHLTEEHIYKGCSLHEERKQAAADIGTKIHDWAEKYIKHKLKEKGAEAPEMPEEQAVQVGVNAFLDWEKAHKVKFISSERVVYSKKYGFIGKMDIEAIVDSKLCLIDLKSSNGLYNSVRMQTAAYVKADEEESDRIYEGRWAIRLAKETEEEYLARMARKNLTREKVGKSPVEVKPYLPFEAKFLDDEVMDIERDFKAFIACKTIYEWDKETDFFRKPK